MNDSELKQRITQIPLDENSIVWIAGAHRDELESGVYAAYRYLVGAEHIRMVWSEAETSGPLDTLLNARGELDSIASLLVAYCDVIPLFSAGDALHFWKRNQAESGAVIFPSRDPRFGYWDGERVSEKNVTSEYAVSGLFYFHSARDAVRRAKQAQQPGAGIVHMLDARTQMYEVRTREILDLGTPQAYQAFMGEGVRA